MPAFIGGLPREIGTWFGLLPPFLRYHVPCSGAFGFERIIRRVYPNAIIQSNDVSLLSSAVGYALMGRELPMSLRSGSEYAALSSYFEDDPWTRVAAIVVLLEWGAHDRRKNAYQQTHWDVWACSVPTQIEHTRKKLMAKYAHLKIDEYTQFDVIKALSAPREDTLVLVDPPTYTSGYERHYKLLDSEVQWDSPEYAIFDADSADALVELLQNHPHWFYLTDQNRPELSCRFLRARPGSHTLYGYGTESEHYFAVAEPDEKDPGWKLAIADEYPRRAQLQVVPIAANVLRHYQILWLGGKTEPKPPMASFAVLIDDDLLGVVGFSPNSFVAGGSGSIYLMCDFVCPKAPPRASKIVVACALSMEIKRAIEERWLSPVDTLCTTAFTDKPVSMKYRGVLTLQSRKPGRLHYTGEMGCKNLKMIYRRWWKRYGRSSRS